MGRARRQLREALGAWGLSALTDTAELVLSELCTNAVQHGRVPGRYIETRFIREGDGVRIEVHDASDRQPERHRAADDDEHGRGLALVNALVGPSHWGVGPREGVGKQVWARCALPADD